MSKTVARFAVYMGMIAYKYGGAEAYAASLIESLQGLYPNSHITLITERLRHKKMLSTDELLEMQNKAYGTAIKNESFSVAYFDFEKVHVNKAKNRLQRYFLIIKRELVAIRRFKTIKKLSRKADVFINSYCDIVFGGAKKNICIVNFPCRPTAYSGINKRLPYLKQQVKKRIKQYQNSYCLYLPNSRFTAEWLKSYWQIPDEKIRVVYPPVKMIAGGGIHIKDGKQILVCGRFNREKKTDVLVNAFKSSEFLSENARLVVAGSTVSEDELFIEELRRGSPQNVSFVLDPDRETLEQLYSSSSFFWHAMGLGTEEPSKFEHFGITTVEAMSAGCVPIVINKGGQKESVEESCGIRWDTVEELVEMTERLIKNPEHTASLRQKCVERARMFSTNSFRENVRKILSEHGCA